MSTNDAYPPTPAPSQLLFPSPLQTSQVNQNSRTPHGFPLEILGLAIPEINPNFICSGCQLILQTPVQALCGHHFCYHCLAALTNGSSSPVICPQCQTEGADLESNLLTSNDGFPDNAINKILSMLPVSCINSECSWGGVFIDYAEHEVQCPLTLITCNNNGCLMKLPRKDIQIHTSFNCLKRCDKDHQSLQSNENTNKCTFGCEGTFDCKQMEDHD